MVPSQQGPWGLRGPVLHAVGRLQGPEVGKACLRAAGLVAYPRRALCPQGPCRLVDPDGHLVPLSPRCSHPLPGWPLPSAADPSSGLKEVFWVPNCHLPLLSLILWPQFFSSPSVETLWTKPSPPTVTDETGAVSPCCGEGSRGSGVGLWADVTGEVRSEWSLEDQASLPLLVCGEGPGKCWCPLGRERR